MSDTVNNITITDQSVELLRTIANATAANADYYTTAELGKPLVQAGLIVPDFNKRDQEGRVSVRLTDGGAEYLTKLGGGANPNEHTKPISKYSVMNVAIELPKSERGFKKGVGGNGQPSKYPFDDMVMGQWFFVPNADVKNGDAVKTVGSAAGSANQRYAVGTGQFETVQRAQRGKDHKAIKGPDGKNVMVQVQVEKKNHTRKFVVRPVKQGQKLGEWTAPADGAIVARVEPTSAEPAAQ